MTQRINREADHFHLVKMIIGTIFLLAMLVLPNMTVCAEGDTVTLSGSGTLTRQFVNENLGDATEVIITGFSEIEDYAFYECSSLTSVTIPNSVTTIGEWAFDGCESLTSVTIPNSVTTIGVYAFSGCSSLTSVTIPNSVTSIGEGAFLDCNSLTSVTIPDSATTFGSGAFSRCSSLKTAGPIGEGYNIEIGRNGSIPSRAFDGCSSLTSVTIPDSVKTIGEWAFYNCSSLTSVTIPNSVTSIGDQAFHGCESLTSVTIPNSVTSIGELAFVDCNSLTSVTIPNSVTTIGEWAFGSCERLTSVTIPNSVTSIGEGVFSGCNSLTSVTIPNSVTSIGQDAFWGCSSLTSVTIPNSVTSIGGYAFEWCSGLTSVTIPNSVTTIGDDAFCGCSNVTIYGYPGTKAEAYANEKGIPFVCIEEEKANDSAEEKIENGFAEVDGSSYWYEGGVKQGTYDDPKGVLGDGTVRGREIYDPVSNGWYWLDACYDGAKACNKEVWMPYIYQNEVSWDDAEIEMNANNSGSMKQQVINFIKNREGKWVRYDANGKMVKGWYTVEGADAELYPEQIGNTYYYDYQTGLMAKGKQVIDGQEYFFDEVTGALQK